MIDRLSDRRLAVLAFHKIGRPPDHEAPTWFYIPEETFREQLMYLNGSDWQVIDIAAFLRGLVYPESLPRRSVLLTFDDGYRSLLDSALSQLRRFAYPAVVFVPTDLVATDNSFDTGTEPVERLCDWNDLRELQRWGVSIQSHGVSHRRFSELGGASQEDELRRSRSVLEERLRERVEVFCYPYGDSGSQPQATAARLRGAGYSAACLYGGGPVLLPVSDPYRLARVAMGPDTDLRAEIDEATTR